MHGGWTLTIHVPRKCRKECKEIDNVGSHVTVACYICRRRCVNKPHCVGWHAIVESVADQWWSLFDVSIPPLQLYQQVFCIAEFCKWCWMCLRRLEWQMFQQFSFMVENKAENARIYAGLLMMWTLERTFVYVRFCRQNDKIVTWFYHFLLNHCQAEKQFVRGHII